MGPVWFAAQTFCTFLKSVRELPVRTVADIDDDEIRVEYKIFCARLGQVEKKQDWKSSRDFIKHFLSTKHKLYVSTRELRSSCLSQHVLL